MSEEHPSSPPPTMSDKEGGGGGGGGGGEKGKRSSMANRYAPGNGGGGGGRSLFCGFLIFILLAGITALVLYLVYRPARPRFSIAGAAVYDLNISSPSASAISTSMQFTVVSRNPSERSSVLYDRLSLYVTYRNQAITPPTPVPPLYVERGSTVAVSPVLSGMFVPVAADVAGGLLTDEAYGVVSLRVVVMGRAKFKSGPFRSPWYGMFVTCDLLVGLKKGVYGQVPLLGAPDCNVDI